MTDPVVRFSRVSKRFGTRFVLREIDFEIPTGRFLGLAGLNGAGKTTLIKCMLDFCQVDEGSIQVHGISWRMPASRSRLAFLPEQFIPPYFLRGREFLQSTLALARCACSEESIRSMIDQLGLEPEALDRPVRAYSKGMTQKLGLAACFLSQREFLLLDEPMSGLDPSARVRVKAILARLKAEGRSLLITSHSLAEIDEICDHMLILHQGKIAFSGTPQALCQRVGEAALENAFLKCIEAPDHE